MRKGFLVAIAGVAIVAAIYFSSQGGSGGSTDKLGASAPTASGNLSNAAGKPPDTPGESGSTTPRLPPENAAHPGPAKGGGTPPSAGRGGPMAIPPPDATAHAARHPRIKNDPRVGRSADGRTRLNDPINLSLIMHSPETTPQDDIDTLSTVLSYYRLVNKVVPVGSENEEIVEQLTGGNPRNVVVLPPDHPAINAAGQLQDRWGTPYFFHGLTRTEMDVWSAGADQTFGTSDDIKLGSSEDLDQELKLSIDNALAE